MNSFHSCPTCVKATKELTGDDLIGTLVEIRDDDGTKWRDFVSPDQRGRRIREAVAAPNKGG